MLGPVNAQIGNLSYVLCAMIGGIMALSGMAGLTLGKLASFLTFNKSFNMPISQVSQQFNAIIMALAGCERIFSLLDEEPETDEGYVTLVNAKEENGILTETPEHTGIWAWKHTHSADGSVEYVRLTGDVVFKHNTLLGKTHKVRRKLFVYSVPALLVAEIKDDVFLHLFSPFSEPYFTIYYIIYYSLCQGEFSLCQGEL